MTEADFYRTILRPKFSTWGWAYDRIENSISPGLPDVNYSTKTGVHGWIELKLVHSDNCIYFERFQPQWLYHRMRVAPQSSIYLIAFNVNRKPNFIHVAHATGIPVKECTPKGKFLLLESKQIRWSFDTFEPYEWNVLRGILEQVRTI